jgi:hypothetical protein
MQLWTYCAEVDEVIKRDLGTSLATHKSLVRTNSDPIHFPRNSVATRFWSNATNANHGFESSIANYTHAVASAEAAALVGITRVSALIDKGTHRGVASPWSRLTSALSDAAIVVVVGSRLTPLSQFEPHARHPQPQGF